MLLESVLTGAVRGGTSILFPTLGEVVAERSGVVNLGTEGCMLAGALAAYAAGIETGSVWVGVIAGLAAGAVLALLHAFLVVSRGANQIATGLVITFLALGLTALYGQDYVGEGVNAMDAVAVPGLSALPFVGPILFDHDPLTYLSFAAAPALWFLLFRTRTGMVVRAAGERPEVLEAFGTSPARVRYAAVVFGGALAGLGGAQLSTVFTRNWSENMTVGRGFVAVALVIFAAWSPLRAMGGAYLFGAALALGPALQVRNTGINQFALDAIPYALTLLVLIVLARRQLHSAPEGLRQVLDHRTPA